jgi:hypothetical protein
VRLTARVLGGVRGRVRTVARASAADVAVRAQRTIAVQGGRVAPGGVTG